MRKEFRAKTFFSAKLKIAEDENYVIQFNETITQLASKRPLPFDCRSSEQIKINLHQMRHGQETSSLYKVVPEVSNGRTIKYKGNITASFLHLLDRESSTQWSFDGCQNSKQKTTTRLQLRKEEDKGCQALMVSLYQASRKAEKLSSI